MNNPNLDDILSRPISAFEFTLRTENVLKSENIFSIRELVRRTEIEISRTPNLGKRALTEIKETLEAFNLSLGMKLPPIAKHTMSDYTLENKMIEQHLELLGSQMRDKVTDAKGMVESVTFDAYGCVQALLRCKVTAEGGVPKQYWVDIKRLLPDGERIMPVPPHFTTPPGKEAGPADKPAFDSLPGRD